MLNKQNAKYLALPMVSVGLLLLGLFIGSAWADKSSGGGIEAAKTVLEQWAVPGQKLTYYIIVENQGDQTKEIGLTDTLPDLTTYSSHTVVTGQEDEFSRDGDVIKWDGELDFQTGKNKLIIRLEVALGEDLGGKKTITNTADISLKDEIDTLSVSVDVHVATPTPENTPTATPTDTSTVTGTGTPTPTATLTTALTATITPSATFSTTPTPTATFTATPTATPKFRTYLPIIQQYLVCKDDRYEPNNSPSDASEISFDVAIRAWFCVEDPDDYYWFTVDSAEPLVEIELYDVHSQSDLDLYLYNKDLELVGFSNEGLVGDPETISTGLQSGEYYVRVYPFDVPTGVRSTYSLKVTKSSTQ